MSRSGYTDEVEDQWGLVCWRGAVNSAIKGKRGQAFLRELAAAMDAMPEKVLAAESLVSADGEFCTLGVVGAARGIDMSKLDPEDWHTVAQAFGLAPAMVREIVFENDEGTVQSGRYDWAEVVGPVQPWKSRRFCVWVPDPDSGAKRWAAMRQWVNKQLSEAK